MFFPFCVQFRAEKSHYKRDERRLFSQATYIVTTASLPGLVNTICSMNNGQTWLNISNFSINLF